MIFIKVEPSRQVLVLELLLDLNERAWGRRSDEDVRMWTEGQKESGRMLQEGGDGWGGGGLLGTMSYRVLSAVTILLRHLRQGGPHPDAPASATHSNCRMVYGSDLHVCVRVCVWGSLKVIRCQRFHVSPGYGVVVASAFNWLIVVIIWVGRSSWHWGCLEGHSHTGGDCPGCMSVCVCVYLCRGAV